MKRQVMVNGVEWMMRTKTNEQRISAGAIVRIEARKRVKLIVKKLERKRKNSMGMVAGIIVGILVILVLLILISNIKIVPQAHAYVIERLGSYQTTWGNGIKFKIPFVERISRKVVLKEQVVDFPPQPVITKDNVTMRIDTVVFFQITDPKSFVYGIENPIMAI